MKNPFKYILLLIIFTAGCAAPQIKETVISEPFDIAITGDIMMSRRVALQVEEMGCDYPFELIQKDFKGSAIVFGNLETALVYKGMEPELEKKGKYSYYFRSDASCARSLKKAGFNIMSVGNNHIIDYGQEGVSQTVRALEEAGIKYCGITMGDKGKPNEPVVMVVNNTRVGFLAYSNVSNSNFAAGPDTYGTIPGIESVLRRDIKNARGQADLLIIYLHWGKENEEVKESQYRLGHKIIDMGADIIVGSHTHEFQDVEVYKGKYIFYGLGNFVFDMRGEPFKYSAILKLNVDDRKITALSIIPVYLDNNRPRQIKDKALIFKFLSGIKLINASLSDIYGDRL